MPLDSAVSHSAALHAVAAPSSPPPPIAAHSLLVFLVQVGVLLFTAMLLGRLVGRFGMPKVVGELSAGVLIGPSVFGHAWPALSAWALPHNNEQYHMLDATGQVGVLLLVGVTGIEVDLAMVRRRGGTALRVGMAGLLIPLALGVAAGFLAPRSLLSGDSTRATFALFVGVAMCVSALPVIAKTLSDMNMLHRNVGQLTLAAGVVDDVTGWFILSIVSAMAAAGVRGSSVGLSLFYLACVAVFAMFAGRRLMAPLLRRAERTGEAGVSIAVVVVFIMLAAAVTQGMGLEASLGAFTAGLVISSSGIVDLSRLAPLRAMVMSVFAPLFFATAGLRVDLGVLSHPVVLASAAIALAIAVVGKFTGAYAGSIMSRLSRWEAMALAGGMNARGVIQIVVATVGLRLKVLDTDTYTIVILIAITTSLMAPPILRRAVRHIEETDEEELRRLELAAFRDPMAQRQATAD